MQKPSIPKGTRDFTPAEMVKRNYIFDTIRDTFKLYGYSPIETPAMENLTTLLGKYGEEGDKLLFRILNSGDFLNKTNRAELPEIGSLQLSNQICDRGLRYDLTVPFARFVVQRRNEITLPFKRYQIQPVWRADRPQKGRYREFFQCDADVVGSNSLVNEVELISMIDEVFAKLNISVTVKMNNRKILAGIADYIEAPDKLVDITVAIDKLEKIGLDNVNQELADKGLTQEAIDKVQPILSLSGNTDEVLNKLSEILQASEVGMKGIEEVKTIFSFLQESPVASKVELDLTLARGLNYYTGAIFEVKANDVQIGSICGGGRYDDLTGIFGLKDVSGVGISFGADRIYDVLNQLDNYPESVTDACQVLIVNFGENEQRFGIKAVKELRAADVSAELYPDSTKLKKQMNYANARNIPYVILAGSEEIESGQLTLKDMVNGEQSKKTLEEIINLLR